MVTRSDDPQAPAGHDEQHPSTLDRLHPDVSNRSDARWIALIFVSLAQLMVALDATVINIALPSAQQSLHI